MDLCNEKDLGRLLSRHGFRFSKAMGQNFLIDSSVPECIAEGAGIDKTHFVLEIGPGIGALTAALCRRAGKVVSVELDNRLLPLLQETLADYDNSKIISGDILKLDIGRLVREENPGLRSVVCANLPYNITSPVLTALMETQLFESITVMVQREVARRICAAPGTPDYGAFSVYVGYHAQPEILFDVAPDCFVPQPKVTSAVVTLVMRTAPPEGIDDEALFFRVVRASFAQRRKTLVNGLEAAFGSALSKQTLKEIIADAGFDVQIRGEALALQDFAAVARRIGERLT